MVYLRLLGKQDRAFLVSILPHSLYCGNDLPRLGDFYNGHSCSSLVLLIYGRAIHAELSALCLELYILQVLSWQNGIEHGGLI